MHIFILFIAFPFLLHSQEIHDKIKIKKSDYSIYFFKIGNTSDSVITSSNNQFILKMGNSRKCKAVIEVYNGRLSEIKKDSLYKLSYMPGMNYRHLFKDTDLIQRKTSVSKTITHCPYFKTEVNGSGTGYNDKTILIKIVSASGDSTFLTNKYYYR